MNTFSREAYLLLTPLENSALNVASILDGTSDSHSSPPRNTTRLMYSHKGVRFSRPAEVTLYMEWKYHTHHLYRQKYSVAETLLLLGINLNDLFYGSEYL